MTFALRLAWRQTRGGWRHSVGALACIVLGVAALTGVGTFAANVDGALAREARALMGGDLELRSAHPLGAAGADVLARWRDAGGVTTDVREMVAMARREDDGRTLLVELKAVDPHYPLYGAVDVQGGRPLADLLAGNGTVVHEALLARLGVGVGDRIAIGRGVFTVRAVLRREPDGPGGFVSLGPRVLIASDALEATGLLAFGSRVRYRTLVRLPATLAVGGARESIARAIVDPGVRVTAFDAAQPGLRRFFEQLGSYLGLVGLVSLLVGGLGVAAAVSTLLRRARASLAILKCLGATSRRLLVAYLLQTQALGLIGSAIGVGLGLAAQPLLVRLLADTVPFALSAEPHPWTAVRALAMGTLTALLCALWPLLAIGDVRPSLLLRRDVDEAARARRPWLATIPVAAGLVALAFWQAGSWRMGAIFVVAAAAALVGLAGLGRALTLISRLASRMPALALRQGVANLRRPGAQTVPVVIALGVGVMLLVAVALLETSLGRQIDHERRHEAPSFFFLDIQADQRDRFTRAVEDATGGQPPRLTPVVRARLSAVKGVPVTRQMVEARRGQGHDETWYLTREYVLTWAEELPSTSTIVRGRWWRPDDEGHPRVSVEEAAARYLDVGPGDTLTFDVQGVPVEAEVTSVRKVDWQSLAVNFFVIFSPGALEGAPTTWVGTARVPPAAEAGLQDEVVRALPNVTAIPLRDVLERAAGILDELAVAIRVIALFSIAAGLAVMLGALAATRAARLYESVVWRTLGATRGVVARIFAVEYACLGAAAGLGGTALAALLAWAVLRFVLDVPWTFAPDALLLGVALTVAVAVVIGFLGTFRLLGEKPLPVLRRE
ncbi:MAG TPA: FtsX-like permease family protein [Methylomirabilota bacterium]|jgi:putative ABC transport system permease protein